MVSIDAIDCPQCNGVDSFGVTWIEAHSVSRRCKSCNHRGRDVLPQIRKTVICLDQNALSQMMMLLNPHFPKERRDRVNPLWVQVLEELYSAVRDQIACCPLDEIHSRESAVFEFGDAILKVAKMLDGETRFRSLNELAGDEFFYSAKHWHSGTPQGRPEFDQIRAFRETPHRWLNLFRFEVTGWRRESPDRIRAVRERLRAMLEPIYERWRTETLSFACHFREELHSIGQSVLQGFRAGMREALFNPDALLLGSPCRHYMHLVRAALEQGGASPDESPELAIEYFMSEGPTNVPSGIVRALLYAKQAHLLRNGMNAPLPSASYDIDRLSSVLPYCDAILMERHFAAMLRELTSAGLLPEQYRRCRVFSVRDLDEFIEYVRTIREATPSEHVAIAQRLYGSDVPDLDAGE